MLAMFLGKCNIEFQFLEMYVKLICTSCGQPSNV